MFYFESGDVYNHEPFFISFPGPMNLHVFQIFQHIPFVVSSAHKYKNVDDDIDDDDDYDDDDDDVMIFLRTMMMIFDDNDDDDDYMIFFFSNEEIYSFKC